MIHEILPVGALQCNCSIFGDEQTLEAIVVDPGDGSDLARVEAILARHSLKVKAIVITHAHIDHIGAAAKLKASTGAPVYMNAADQVLYDHLEMQAGWLGMRTPDRTPIDVSPKDGDRLKLGEVDLHVLHTPGHTPGSISIWIPASSTLVAGDTLFRDSIGRTDLAGREWSADSGIDSRQAAHLAGRDVGDRRTRIGYDDRSGKRAQPVSPLAPRRNPPSEGIRPHLFDREYYRAGRKMSPPMASEGWFPVDNCLSACGIRPRVFGRD